MIISRRTALGSASAFALTTQFGLASTVKRAVTAAARARAPRPGQRFIAQLIDAAELSNGSYARVIWIDGPDSMWAAMDTLEDLQYRVANGRYKARGYRLRRVSAFQTGAGQRYAAIWEKIAGPEWHSKHDMSHAEFEKAAKDYANNGYRMTHVDARLRFAAIWERGDSKTQQIFTALKLKDFETQFATMASQGFQPLRLSATAADGQTRITAIFEKASDVPRQAYYQLSARDFEKKDAAMIAQGFRLADASGHVLNGKSVFCGVWEAA